MLLGVAGEGEPWVDPSCVSVVGLSEPGRVGSRWSSPRVFVPWGKGKRGKEKSSSFCPKLASEGHVDARRCVYKNEVKSGGRA